LPSPRPPGPILLRTKLGPPPARAGLIPRSRLDAQLEAGAKGRLCLVDAPAGSGKTTLLAQWWRAGDDTRQLAWLSLDDGDDDPVRFWSYVIEAFRVVEPGLGEDALAELQSSGTTDLLTQVVLPQLLNELAGRPCDLVLVLDDYHLVTNAVCHASLGFFVDHLPANVHLIVATRADPPLALARLRASGELVELRIAELGFTSVEAELLLGQAMGLELTAAQTRRLWERTEGWAAGLYLAGLSLRGRRDPGPFIASFEAGHRHVVDYLGAEVPPARGPARLHGPQLDPGAALGAAVRRGAGDRGVGRAAGRAGAGQPVPHRPGRPPPLVPLPPSVRPAAARGAGRPGARAGGGPAPAPAAFHQQAGDVEAAVHHASAGGDLDLAGTLITGHWLPFARRGRIATVQRWLDGLPEEVIATWPSLAVAAMYLSGYRGAPRAELDRWVAMAEAAGGQGPVPDWATSVPFEIAMVRAQYSTTTPAGRWRRPAGPWSWPARNRPSRAGWPRRPWGGTCTWPGSRPRPGRCWGRSPSTTSPPTSSLRWGERNHTPTWAHHVAGAVALHRGEPAAVQGLRRGADPGR
jgi:LuxR family maltose regulon positive regulatory protein